MQRISPLDRFWSKVNYLGKWSLVNEEWSRCWEWTHGKDGSGYGSFWIDEQKKGSHRWIYEHIHGPLDSKIELDHLCRNKVCVRDSHLEPVTHQVNTLRGIGPTAINAAKEICDKGHFLTQHPTRDQRWCEECDRENKKTYYETKGKFLPVNKEKVRENNKASWERIKNDENRREERNRKKREAWAKKIAEDPSYNEKRREKANKKYAEQKSLNSPSYQQSLLAGKEYYREKKEESEEWYEERKKRGYDTLEERMKDPAYKAAILEYKRNWKRNKKKFNNTLGGV